MKFFCVLVMMASTAFSAESITVDGGMFGSARVQTPLKKTSASRKGILKKIFKSELNYVELRDANVQNVLDLITEESRLKTNQLTLSGRVTMKLEKTSWYTLLKNIRKQASH